MPETSSFRQVDEKHVSAEVECMQWSPKMDLIAVANVQGEIILYRLSWQKVWTLAAPAEDSVVTCLSWRPDGKVLAVGYKTGRILLCDVENSAMLHDLQFTSTVTSMTWVSEVTKVIDPESAETSRDCFNDCSAQYLPKLPPYAKSYSALSKEQGEENIEDAKKLKGQTDLNILVVGMEDGHIHMYAYGIFPVGRLDLNQHGTGRTGHVLCGHLSADLHLLSLLVDCTNEETDNREVCLISFDTVLLASRHKELRILALKFGQVLTLLTCLDSTIQQMSEAWEDILMEMDSKLMTFAEEKKKACSGAVSNDFLRLLMFGIPSNELQLFLLHTLTEKGLKKLGHSIETSYSNIQKLVLKHLQSVGQAMVYHLSDLSGMSHWYDKFGVLGLSTPTVQQAISTAGSFMLKASELQQVIDGSMKNFKAFFRWLYVVIQRLSEEPIPAELSKMTQQDLNFVAQFLKENFTEDTEDGNSGSGFKLEKVGQYLKDEDLHDPPDNSGNAWVTFLQEHSKVEASGLLYPAYTNKSLIQMYELLQNSIDTTLHKCATVIGHSLQCVSTTYLYTPDLRSENEKFVTRTSQCSAQSDDGSKLYTAFTCSRLPAEKCWITRQNTTSNRNIEAVSVEVGDLGNADDSRSSTRCSSHKILDVCFYDGHTLSLLVQECTEDTVPVLAQLPLAALNDSFTLVQESTEPLVSNSDIACVDAASHVESQNYQRLENMKASAFAVSGTRKVACVLFASKRRVRLFMMDVEEEEEEEEDTGLEDTVDQSQADDTGQELQHSGNVFNDADSDGAEEDENKENSVLDSTTGMDMN